MINFCERVIDSLPDTKSMLISIMFKRLRAHGHYNGVPVKYVNEYIDITDKAACCVAHDRYCDAVMASRGV